jgi:hypothetical protein
MLSVLLVVDVNYRYFLCLNYEFPSLIWNNQYFQLQKAGVIIDIEPEMVLFSVF